MDNDFLDKIQGGPAQRSLVVPFIWCLQAMFIAMILVSLAALFSWDWNAIEGAAVALGVLIAVAVCGAVSSLRKGKVSFVLAVCNTSAFIILWLITGGQDDWIYVLMLTALPATITMCSAAGYVRRRIG